jgi:hypothetical protein
MHASGSVSYQTMGFSVVVLNFRVPLINSFQSLGLESQLGKENHQARK